jgi:hypothetical protein
MWENERGRRSDGAKGRVGDEEVVKRQSSVRNRRK